jgi:predicted phosphodiesterase
MHDKNIRFKRIINPNSGQTTQSGNTLRIVCLSDMHSLAYDTVIPDGDVLVHAGDICGYGKNHELDKFNHFLAGLPHKHKLFIAGNHDWPIYNAGFADSRSRINGYGRVSERSKSFCKKMVNKAAYLEDSGIEIDGIKFWGSPWQPEFFDWAFNLPRGQALADKWALIPDDTDVLITHGPPFGVLDQVIGGEHVGCEELLVAVQRIKPKVHVFGHIHEAYGMREQNGTTFVNASVCTERYRPTNPPIVIELEKVVTVT